MKTDFQICSLLAFFIHYRRYGEFAGGSERRFLETAKLFKKLGLQVYVLELEPSLKDTWIDAGYHSLTISSKRPRNILELLSLLFYLCFLGTRLCKKLDCDIVYATKHELPENVIPAYIASRFCHKPLVIVFNAAFKKDETTTHEILLDRLKKGFNPISATLLTLLDLTMTFIYKEAEACIAVSLTMKKEITQNFKTHRTVISGNGITFEKYRTKNDREKIYDATFVGRIHPSKGIYTLLHAWKRVTDEMPQAKLVLVGGGVKGIIEYYKKMIKKLKLENNVTLVDFIWDDEELVQILKSSRIFVFPSLKESFGISVAEAMACGLPCIISDIPALKEVFSGMAVFINPCDADNLAKAILDLLKNAKERQTLSVKGFKYIKKLSWEKVAKKELETFKKVMHSSISEQKCPEAFHAINFSYCSYLQC